MGYNPQPGRVDFGYALAQLHWNNGYMTEAVRAMLRYCFEVLNATVVQAFHLRDNVSSGRVLLKAGMELDDAAMRDRQDEEVHCLLTAQAWQSAQREF